MRGEGGEAGSHVLWVKGHLGGRGVGGGEAGGVDLLLQAARGAEHAGGGGGGCTLLRMSRGYRGRSCQGSFLAARPPFLAPPLVSEARGSSTAPRSARGARRGLERILGRLWWFGAAVLASRSTRPPCPGWSTWARLGSRAQPQVELGPGLVVAGVEVQGGLRPRGPETVEGGQEVEDLLLVGVLEHVGGLLDPGHPGVEHLKQQPQGCCQRSIEGVVGHPTDVFSFQYVYITIHTPGFAPGVLHIHF